MEGRTSRESSERVSRAHDVLLAASGVLRVSRESSCNKKGSEKADIRERD